MTEHRRLCVGCRGEGWTTGPEVNGWPTIAPCPECRPTTAALNAAGAYQPDAPIHKESDRFQGIASTTDDPVPRTALWPFPQYLAEWPAPGQRTTTPREP
jgi:hypothetical protein